VQKRERYRKRERIDDMQRIELEVLLLFLCTGIEFNDTQDKQQQAQQQQQQQQQRQGRQQQHEIREPRAEPPTHPILPLVFACHMRVRKDFRFMLLLANRLLLIPLPHSPHFPLPLHFTTLHFAACVTFCNCFVRQMQSTWKMPRLQLS